MCIRDSVYYKFTDQEWYDTHGSGRGDFVVDLRDALAKLPPEKLHGDITKGQEIQLGDIRAVVMNDPYLLDATSVNNSSVVFKFYLNGVSILVLGDLGPEGGQDVYKRQGYRLPISLCRQKRELNACFFSITAAAFAISEDFLTIRASTC